MSTIQKRQVVSVVLAVLWFSVVAGVVLALGPAVRADSPSYTADLIVPHTPTSDSGLFDRKKKTEDTDDNKRTEPYKEDTAPQFDLPEPVEAKRQGIFARLFSKFSVENITEIVVPLLALFGGAQLAGSDSSIKAILTLLSALKKEKFNEILKDVPRSDNSNPLPDPPAETTDTK